MIGRLAPSPTGAQHLGNARTFLIAWLLARRSKSPLWLRIEDLETPRVKTWATHQAVEDLKWLGLDWDAWPGNSHRGFVLQTERLERYDEILRELRTREWIYPCTCTRSQIESIAAAPHEAQRDGAVYPGTCSGRSTSDADELTRKGLPFAWRFRLGRQPMSFIDQFRGGQLLESPVAELGDFVVARSNGIVAYQLAVVIDDYDMKVEQVVRGDDLLLSTFRQLALYAALGWQPPTFCHVPLVVGADGRRLAKRHGDTRLATYREAGVSAETILGRLAWRSGLLDEFKPTRPSELIDFDPLANLSREPLVIDADF